MRRVVSLFLPHWSTDRLRRKSVNPPPEGVAEIASNPLVTAVSDHGRRIVAAVDPAARALGIRPGMTLTRARLLAEGLDVVDADPQADLEGLRRLALWVGRRYAPVVAIDPPDGLWLDITGCAELFGNERALLKDLQRRVAAFGLSVQIAAADTAGCAHAVARYVPAGRPVTVLPGAHRKALALLPVAALRLDAGMVEGLRKLGFQQIEQLMANPRAPLAKRFGLELHRRLDQALGTISEPLDPVFPPEYPRAWRSFVEPLATAEAFTQVIGDLVAEVAGQLARQARGARRLDCHFHRVDGLVQAIRVGAAAPSRAIAHLVKLLAARIDTIDPGLGIEAMTLVVTLAEPLGAQQREGLEPPGRSGPDLAVLIDALANRFGYGRLYRVAPHPSVMPERSVQVATALGPASSQNWDKDLPRPARMLSPPEPVEVTAMLPDHPPAIFRWRGKRFRVSRADGPERLHGEWWREGGHEAAQPYAVRDYYQVETTSGARYWLFRLGDGENPATGPMRWFIHGAFS